MNKTDRNLFRAELSREAVADYLEQLAKNINSSSITIRSPKGEVTLPVPRVTRCCLVGADTGDLARIRLEIAGAEVDDAIDEDDLIF